MQRVRSQGTGGSSTNKLSGRLRVASERQGTSGELSALDRSDTGRRSRCGPRRLAREMSQFRRVAGPGYVTRGAGRVGDPPWLRRRAIEGAGPQVAGPQGGGLPHPGRAQAVVGGAGAGGAPRRLARDGHGFHLRFLLDRGRDALQIINAQVNKIRSLIFRYGSRLRSTDVKN
ncbi:unnamed protein product [Arctia plantaginis]|uniref:Uncharacterized protein n=1 Tax=Arctia plantaginis TaxID=874455 RepID=A0A8S0YZG4_ARCPL|nr:unnamed protein product [Arctia plantaginis]